MPRTTHTAEVEFDLDPSPGISAITVYAAAEQTAKGHPPDFDDPGAPAEYDLHTVQIYDHHRKVCRNIDRDEWECLFGVGAWCDLLEFLEGELEEEV